MAKYILKTENLIKRYGNLVALKGINLIIEEGAIVGLLGPNGSGKTTFIRIVNNILEPTEGQVLFYDEPLTRRHNTLIGYLPEERGLYPKISVADQIVYFGMLKGLSRGEAKQKARQWLEKLNALDWWNKKVDDLSKGMQQKIQFVVSVINQPKLLILDEPFTGFDPINLQLIKGIIKELNDNGTTIILSTHRMEQVEDLCSHIIFINKGKVLQQGEINEVKRKWAQPLVRLKVDKLFEDLDIRVVKSSLSDDGFWEVVVVWNHSQVPELMEMMIDKGIKIYEVEPVEPSLEDLFVNLVKAKDEETVDTSGI